MLAAPDRRQRCLNCGTERDSDAATEGLCPRCLFILALDDPEPDGDPEAPTRQAPTRALILGERYQLVKLLGRGGMGEVWRAFDVKLRVDVALKSLRPDRLVSDRDREVLRQEVRRAREVVSPSVCRIFDLVESEHHELVSMEFVDGTTLADTLLERGPLPLPEAHEVASQFLMGLEAIHQAGLVHRDFKPENVMLTRAGRVVVMDFGLATSLAEPETVTGGTPPYMPPEQLRGEPVDPRADVFAAGVVLAEMLTVGGAGGRESREALWSAVREVPPQVPDGPWAPVLRKALDPRREDRHASARALAHALEEVALRLPGAEERRPYPGLASFTEEDAEYFFGREVEVEAVWKKLKRPRLLAVIGPSGTGKSSFIRAGLLPTLPSSWASIVATPGLRPFHSLARALLPVFSADAEAMERLLRFEELSPAVEVVSQWRRQHESVLVVVDQFEELFTLVPAPVQARFAELLGRLVLDADAHVLLSLRDDFLFQCQSHEALAPILSDLTLLGPLDEGSLRRALVQPALSCGYRFEDESVVEEMLETVRHERGALPLLAFAASQLWEKRDRERGLFTREAYEQIGGVAGALAQHAESTLERIGSPRIPVVREIFRNLVTAQGTRAAREREDLLSMFGRGETAESRSPVEPEAARAPRREPPARAEASVSSIAASKNVARSRNEAGETLDALVDARLLVSYERTGEGGESHQEIEIVHESLLSRWPRLVRWQAQDAEGALLRDQLRQAAQAWQDRGRPEDLLWSGTAYREYALWRERYPGKLTALEEDFSTSMVARARRSRRRRRVAVASIVAVAVVVATVTAVLWLRSERARARASAEARRAEASKLVALAEARLEDDPTEALALTTASLELADTREARVFVMRALGEGPPVVERLVEPHYEASQNVAFSPDGRYLATAGDQENIHVFAENGEEIAVLPSHGVGTRPSRVEWDSARVLVSGRWLEDRLEIWAIPEGRSVRTIELNAPSAWQVARGHLLTRTDEHAGAAHTTILRSWPLRGGEPQSLGRVDLTAHEASASAFSPDGSGWLYSDGASLRRCSLPWRAGDADRLLTRHDADVVFLSWRYVRDGLVSVDVSGRSRLLTFPGSGPPRVTIMPVVEPAPEWVTPETSGRWLAEGTTKPTQSVRRIWSRTSWAGARPLVLRRNANIWGAPQFHPDGSWIVIPTDQRRKLTLWPLVRPYPTVLDGWAGVIAFSPDSRWLLTSWRDNSLRLLPVGEDMGRKPRRLDLPVVRTGIYWPYSAAFEPEGRYVFVVGAVGNACLVPLDGSPARRLEGLSANSIYGFFSAAISPSGRRVASGFQFGDAKERALFVWDVETGARQRFELPEGCRNLWSLAFVDESTLYSGGEGGIFRWNLDQGTHELVLSTPPDHDVAMRLSVAAQRALVRRSTHAEVDCLPVESVDLGTGAARPLPEFGDCVGRLALAIDPSGTVAATGGHHDGLVRVGRLDGGEPHLLAGHVGPVRSVALSPDLRWVASTGEDDTLRLWRVPDLWKPPLHALPHVELLTRLRSFTNLRAVRATGSPTGWTIETGPFPGWKEAPEW